ncbi:transcriptional-regulating factor 1 [Scleropages formosus]|uniref:Transcriptional-regulating factor 1-like n=1 Tax=Scleropages formosus TaxID=113540 RepID=A0A8C9TML3_SCLFO|nr:transcriptional-regulating factor 1-like [Scleropages formosus]
MGERTILEPQDTPSHHGLFYPLAKAQQHGQLYCHEGQDAIGQLEGIAETSGSHNNPSVFGGRGDGGCTSEDHATFSSWISPSLVHMHMDFSTGGLGDGLGRGKRQSSSELLPSWRPAYCHHGGCNVEGVICEQKLDSFSEAFSRRNAALLQNGGRGVIFTSGSGVGAGRASGGLSVTRVVTDPAAPPTPPTTHSSPLLLCPPPTPLSLASLAPSRNTPQFPAAQVTQSLQLDADFNSEQSYYTSHTQTHTHPPHSPATALTGKCPPLQWGQHTGDPGAAAEPSQPQPQDKDSNPSIVYPGDPEFALRQPASTHQNEYSIPDHCLQTPINSPQGQYPSSCASFLPDPNTPATTDQMAPWHLEAADRDCVLPCTPLPPPSCPQGEGARAGAEEKLCLGSPSTGSWPQSPLNMQSTPLAIYTGLPFPSILQAGRTLEMDWSGAPPHYTPRPMLNPQRRGSGLYCSLLPTVHLHSQHGNQGSLWPEEGEDCLPLPEVNVGPAFQTELPEVRGSMDADMWLEEPPREELLWKPWEELEENDKTLEQVEIFLDLCSSSAVPGGGTNIELALHCLSRCQGNILAAVEMLLLSTPSFSGDYHYCGSDVWMLSERRLFNKAFAIYSKDFSLIHNMVKTKRVSQCVEFYYLSKKIPEQQRKQREREKLSEGELSGAMESAVFPTSELMVRPRVMDGLMPSNSLATSFPCKQCGKMFYKIKSRNAHMKIHRQQQDDWRERDKHPTLAQNLNQARLTFLQNSNSHVGALSNPSLSSTPVPMYAPPPTWDPFDIPSDPSTFYYDAESKVVLSMAGGPKGQIRWQ